MVRLLQLFIRLIDPSDCYMSYKAKLGGLKKYHENDLCGKRCAIPISIGNPDQMGEKLKSTLIMISKRFSYSDIIVADTLQRYNIMDEYSEEKALRIKKNEGGDWIRENKYFLSNLIIPHKIIR